jgi:hypothetical protein
VIALYNQQGFAGVSKTDVNGESRMVFGNARAIVRAFSQEEQRLLDVRDASEQSVSRNTERLLIFGSALAAMLLLIACFIIAREMKQRHDNEVEREKLIGELQGALAEVKTLSGMIPICGWCKSVRSDKGFWQTVEQYVGAHTDATFSHGMCPNCAEKFKADIYKANPKESA